jgi:hypothetical protein
MDKAQCLAYARNEIRKAESRMNIEFDESVSEEEREYAKEICQVEVNYISFLLSVIGHISGDKSHQLVDSLIVNSFNGGGIFQMQ